MNNYTHTCAHNYGSFSNICLKANLVRDLCSTNIVDQFDRHLDKN